MSNAYDEFLSDDEPRKEVSEGGALRKKLEAAIKLLREKDAEIAELRTVNASRVVEDLLSKNEVPEKFHKLAKKELGDNPSEDAFKNFLTEYGDLWGAEDEEVNPELNALTQAVSKINSAADVAKNVTAEPFKMPTQVELSRMGEAEITSLMQQIHAQPNLGNPLGR